MKFEIKYCYEINCPEWDSFVEENGGEIFQTSTWAKKELKYNNWKSIRFYVKNDKSLVAGCQILIINDLLFGNIGYIIAGPCFKIKTPELMSLVVKEIKTSVQLLNLSYLIIQPNYKEHELAPFLENEKFEPNSSQFHIYPPFKYIPVPGDTLFLDLSLSFEELLKQMNENRRRGIKKGLKSPLKIKLGGRDDLKSYYDLFLFTVSRNIYTDPITQKNVVWTPMITYDELFHIWDELSPHGWVKLFLGYVEDELICGALTYSFGKIFQYQHWGWNRKYSEYHIPDAMHWEMIQWAKTNGFEYYDFCEIDKDIANAFRSGEPMTEALKKKYFVGATLFKIQFGGITISYPKEYIYFSNKMNHLLETSRDDLIHLTKLYKDFYWGGKNFFRDHQVNFPCCETFFL